MMDTLTIILLGLVVLLYLKWILIILVFPFQVMHGQILRKWEKSKNVPLVYRVLDKPYNYWEKIFRKGWQRYMLYQVGLIPSHHIRRFVYKALGAEIGKNVVFHFRTEVRCPHRLKIGDGTIIGDNALLAARRGLTIGKNVNLIGRFSGVEKVIGLYIKFNKLENKYVIVVSFHEQKHPLTYYFK